MVYEKMRSYLQSMGVSVSDLAAQSGLTVSVLNDILNGKSEIGLIEYYRICSALNVPYEYFVSE